MRRTVQFLVATTAAVLAAGAQAGPVDFLVDDFNNDCSGAYGQPFDECVIGPLPNGPGISSIIVKFDVDDSDSDNPVFLDPSIESTPGDRTTDNINQTAFPDFTLSNLSLGAGDAADPTGSWTYTPDADDPLIRFWVAKAASGFRVHYVLSDADEASCGGFSTFACMNRALAVNSGSWETPLNTQGVPRGLSHIAFYDSVVHRVPEPDTIALLGLGLLGLGLARRRARKA